MISTLKSYKNSCQTLIELLSAFIVKTRSTDSEEATAWSQEIEKRSRFSAPKKIMKKEEVKEKNEDIQPLDLFSQNVSILPIFLVYFQFLGGNRHNTTSIPLSWLKRGEI